MRKALPILVARLLGCYLAFLLMVSSISLAEEPLGLPSVPVPEENPITSEKVVLGEKLFNDERFSTTGEVSCATCHDPDKTFSDSPLAVSEGIDGLQGTRNAPTVINAAYMDLQFWDGREPDLESQSKQPFLNPVEMGLETHEPILEVIRGDAEYAPLFGAAFNLAPDEVTMEEVSKAIASFERTLISGNSPFDRYRFGGEPEAMSDAVICGLEVFEGDGRCVSCHTISHTFALFTDSKFHNLNVSFEKISGAIEELTTAYQELLAEGADVDVLVLTDVDISELGRFAVTAEWRDIGAFKTPTLRNVAMTAPYMHDGSQETLEDVVDFYNNGGKVEDDDPLNDFQSGGIRPLDLTDQQKDDLVTFLEALTSPEYEESSFFDRLRSRGQ